jgi:hypothetical protein
MLLALHFRIAGLVCSVSLGLCTFVSRGSLPLFRLLLLKVIVESSPKRYLQRHDDASSMVCDMPGEQEAEEDEVLDLW